MPPSDASEAPSQKPPEGQSVSEPDADEEDRAILAQLTIGSIVDGKYRVDRVLGRGAMGVVIQATHVHLGEKVALKFLRYRAKSGTEDFQTRFKREARVSAKLKNEHITRVIDVGVWKERVPYMVMDYLEGGDLRELIKAQGPLPIGVAVDFTVQVCVGIAEAHANGIVHRDLKPSNLFLTKRPDGSDLVKVLDFGISKWRAGEAEVEELTQTGVVLGSPKYMAPEQLFGSADVDARADVWSIAAIVYEMLSGRPPFDLPTFTRICAELSTTNPPPSLTARRPDVTPELEAVIMKCFIRNPDERTRDVAELAGNLLDAVQAPFAAPMRQKIASMLDPSGANMTGSGAMGAMPSGAYGSMTSGSFRALSSTGSGQRSPLTDSGHTPPSSNGPNSTASAQLLDPEPPRRSALVPGLAIGALVVVAIAAYVSLSGHDSKGASATGQPSATVVQPTSPPTSTFAVASVTANPQPPVAASASAAPSASATTAAVTPPAPPPPPGRPYWRPQRPAPPPPATVAAQAPPVPAPTPAPAPTAPPTPKADPLGDRQ
jgi:eukaryotic-like serine/threonine-protein kinase